MPKKGPIVDLKKLYRTYIIAYLDTLRGNIPAEFGGSTPEFYVTALAEYQVKTGIAPVGETEFQIRIGAGI